MNQAPIYSDGRYLAQNPTWHIEDSAWKADQIFRMIQRNSLRPRTVCDVGCGVGEVLSRLSCLMSDDVAFRGYELSPYAHALCREKESSNIAFELGNVFSMSEEIFDVVLAIDVIEHIEDYLGFLRRLRDKGRYKIFHVPLDMSVNKVLRSHLLLRARRETGHLHYFNKETAMASLEDTGHSILDWFYTPWRLELELERNGTGSQRKILQSLRPGKAIRRAVFRMNRDLAVRLLGGFSLMVLTK